MRKPPASSHGGPGKVLEICQSSRPNAILIVRNVPKTTHTQRSATLLALLGNQNTNRDAEKYPRAHAPDDVHINGATGAKRRKRSENCRGNNAERRPKRHVHSDVFRNADSAEYFVEYGHQDTAAADAE